MRVRVTSLSRFSTRYSAPSVAKLFIPLLIVASLWYLAATSVLMVGQYFLEKRFARGIGERRPEPARAAAKSAPIADPGDFESGERR